MTRCHPTLNSELLYRIRHGKVHPRKGIERFEGKKVHFKDGKVEEFDAVIAATGYKIAFPFSMSASSILRTQSAFPFTCA
ncbi:MAG: hypothetical protein H6559_21610 [Lewinellaceae bacterium]|nr:hypothetical protein [Lewinellaceae bacterium]